MESVINNLDDMLVPCQHGTSYNKATATCNCMNTPLKENTVANVIVRMDSVWLEVPLLKRDHYTVVDVLLPQNVLVINAAMLCRKYNIMQGVCQNGFYGALCDKT